jgi:hypothetical protein
MKYAYNLKLPDLFRNKDVDFIFVGFEDSNNNLIHRVDVKQFTSKPILFEFNSDNKPTYVVYWGYKDSWLDDYKIVENLIDDLSINTRVKFFISGDLGDIIYCLPTIKSIGGAELYIGGNYDLMPVRQQITVNIFNQLKEILDQQDYIIKVSYCTTQPHGSINLNEFKSNYIGWNNGKLTAPEIDQLRQIRITKLFADLVQVKDPYKIQWLKNTNSDKSQIIINRTERYNNDSFPWKHIVDKYSEHIKFIGTNQEYTNFIKEFGTVKYVETNRISDIYKEINNCSVFIGNQSFCYAIAEGLKKPTIQESHTWVRNCLYYRDNALIFDDNHIDINKIDEFISTYHKDVGIRNNSRVEVTAQSKRIYYIGQTGNCGYAKACKGNIYNLINSGHRVDWFPLKFDDSDDTNSHIDYTCNQLKVSQPTGKYDEIHIHTTPNIWNIYLQEHGDIFANTKKIGYSVWETDRLPDSWVDDINTNVDSLILPSEFNKCIYINSGVTVPIQVIPHFLLSEKLPIRKDVSIYSVDNKKLNPSKFTFYNISELTTRKGVIETLQTFKELFGDRTDVQFLLKTHYRDNSIKNQKYCIDTLAEYLKLPNIFVVVKSLNEKELLSIHSVGDCYVSLHKGEGYGLVIHEAYNYNKKIITTGYGGQMEFLPKNYEGAVAFTKQHVKDMEFFSEWYSTSQTWGVPNLNHAKQLMMQVFS